MAKYFNDAYKSIETTSVLCEVMQITHLSKTSNVFHIQRFLKQFFSFAFSSFLCWFVGWFGLFVGLDGIFVLFSKNSC